MPQIRVSEESYRLLKERAKHERRTLSNMVAVLLIPTVEDTAIPPPTHRADTSPPNGPPGGRNEVPQIVTEAAPPSETTTTPAEEPQYIAHSRSEAKRRTAQGHPSVAKQDLDEDKARAFREKYRK